MNLITLHLKHKEPQRFVVTHFHDIPPVLKREYDVNVDELDLIKLANAQNIVCDDKLIQITKIKQYNQ